MQFSTNINTRLVWFILIFLIISFISKVSSQTRRIDSLVNLVNQEINAEKKLLLLNSLADEQAINYPSKAILTANKAIKLANELKDDEQLCIALNVMSESFYYNDNFSDAMSYLERAYPLAKRIGDDDILFKTLFYIGRTKYALGKNNEAVDNYKQALKLIPTVKSNIEKAQLYNSLAGAYLDQGNWNLAHQYYMQELEIAEKDSLPKFMAQAYNNIAMVYDEQKKYDKAIEYYNKDIFITKQLNDEEGLSLSYNNLGIAYMNIKDYTKGKECLEKAIEIAERLHFKYGLSLYYNSMGSLYEEIGDANKALLYYKKDLEAAQKYSTRFNLAASYQSLGSFFVSQKKFVEAEENLMEALRLGKDIKSMNIIGEVEHDLSDMYKLRGDYKNAYDHFIIYKQYYDSMFTKESEKIVAEVNAKYETDKREQKISLLHKEQDLAQAEVKKQKLIRYMFTFGFLLMIGLAFFAYKSYRIKQKANEALGKQKKEILEKNEELQVSRNAMQKQKEIIEEKQKEIVDSINYAKRIQQTLLAHDEFLSHNLPNHFVLFKPKDIVSGDFYWATKKGNKFYLAVCDSTGHGVPGAFMSLLNIGFLSEAINEKNLERPNEIFDYVRQKLIDNLGKEEQKDGFDGILLCVENGEKYSYAAAHNKPIMVANGVMKELKTNKMPVGIGERKEAFELFTIEASKGDMLYLYTDGFADQFGGPKGKKFKYKQLNELIVSNSSDKLSLQKDILNTRFEEWKGNLEQVDDVCVVGIRL